MNKLVITGAFLLHLAVLVKTTASQQHNDTMLDRLVSTENHTDYKCPYLRATMLNAAQFDFLNACPGSRKFRTNSDMLCVLFYNNFLRLCSYSGKMNFDLRTLLNDSTVKAILAKPDVGAVCGTLRATRAFNQTINATVTRINQFMDASCPVICVSIQDNAAYPVCTLSAMMGDFVRQLVKTVVQADAPAKQEIKVKPANAPPKPPEPPKKVNETAPPENKPSGKKDLVVKMIQAPLPPPQHEPKPLQTAVESKPKPENKPPVVKQPDVDVHVHEEAPKESGVQNQSPVKPETKGKKTADAPKVEVPKTDANDKLEEKAKDEDADRLDAAVDNRDNQYEMEDDLAIPKMEEDEPNIKPGKPKPKETNEDIVAANPSNQIEEEDSFFFVYFMMVCAVFILGYIGYHNKQKVLALVIEGRRGRRTSRRGSRPNSANYHKLDSNLEEAVTSAVHKNATNIIY